MSLDKSQIYVTDNTHFAKCPSCQQNFMLDSENGNIITKARNCKFCNFWIEEPKIVLSNLINQNLTESLQSAGEVKGFNYAVPIILGVVLFEISISYLYRNDFPFFSHIVFIFTSFYFYSGFKICSDWLKKYQELRIYDNELMEAKKNIGLSKNIWIAGLVFNIFIWLAFISYFKINQ